MACVGLVAIFQPGLRVQPLHLLHHVAEVLVGDAADALQRRQVVDGEQMQILDQRRHGGVAAIELLQLQGQAFAQVAGKDAARLEALHDLERRLDELDRRAEKLGQRLELALQIARLVGHIDEMLADQPLRRDR